MFKSILKIMSNDVICREPQLFPEFVSPLHSRSVDEHDGPGMLYSPAKLSAGRNRVANLSQSPWAASEADLNES